MLVKESMRQREAPAVLSRGWDVHLKEGYIQYPSIAIHIQRSLAPPNW